MIPLFGCFDVVHPRLEAPCPIRRDRERGWHSASDMRRLLHRGVDLRFDIERTV